jgi:hypothetical protein
MAKVKAKDDVQVKHDIKVDDFQDEEVEIDYTQVEEEYMRVDNDQIDVEDYWEQKKDENEVKLQEVDPTAVNPQAKELDYDEVEEVPQILGYYMKKMDEVKDVKKYLKGDYMRDDDDLNSKKQAVN